MKTESSIQKWQVLQYLQAFARVKESSFVGWIKESDLVYRYLGATLPWQLSHPYA